MKKQALSQEALPADVRACVEQLKRHEPPLPPSVERGLYQARQAALGRFAERQQQQHLGSVLAWVSFGHPRLLSMLAFSVGMLLATMIWVGLQSNEDALMLGDDMPIDAFVDNGFEAWGMSDHS